VVNFPDSILHVSVIEV